MTKEKRGGRRQGAGRKRKPRTKRSVSFYLPVEVINGIECDAAGRNMSASDVLTELWERRTV